MIKQTLSERLRVIADILEKEYILMKSIKFDVLFHGKWVNSIGSLISYASDTSIDGIRVRPETEPVPLDFAEIPLGSSIQRDGQEMLIVGKTADGRLVTNGASYTAQGLMKGRFTVKILGETEWKPCYKQG